MDYDRRTGKEPVPFFGRRCLPLVRELSDAASFAHQTIAALSIPPLTASYTPPFTPLHPSFLRSNEQIHLSFTSDTASPFSHQPCSLSSRFIPFSAPFSVDQTLSPPPILPADDHDNERKSETIVGVSNFDFDLRTSGLNHKTLPGSAISLPPLVTPTRR